MRTLRKIIGRRAAGRTMASGASAPAIASGWTLFLALMCGLALTSTGVLEVAAGPVAASFQLPDNPLQGRLLFERHRCHQCHGISSTGTGPDLGSGRIGHSFFDLAASLWNHVPGMSVGHERSGFSWPELEQAEVIELIAFLYYIDYLGRPGVAAEGQRLFATKGCAVCHTIGGHGGDVGPDLGQLERFASPLYIAQAIWNHGPSMFESMREQNMAPPQFGVGDLADLSAYMRQEGSERPQERMLLTPGNPNRGEQVFEAKGCATCHAERGRGGRGGPDLRQVELHRSAEGVAAIMWNHALGMSETMRERGVDWPDFTTVELADLIAFLYFLPFADVEGDRERGAEVFTSRACASCHGASAATAPHGGPDLAGTAVARSPATLVAAMWNHAPIMMKAILGGGHPWPSLSGEELRDLYAYLQHAASVRSESSGAGGADR